MDGHWKLNWKVQWPVKRLYARSLKHNINFWVKETESLRAAEHEEEVHMMCEPEKGGYLDGKGEDVDIEFADKLMDIGRGSYHDKEEGDADVRATEDLKDCFVETNQHGRMEEKELAETEVTYFF